MEIIGRGFFARNLQPIASAHPGVTVLAAGVARTRTAAEAEYRREARLVHRTLADCARRGRTLVFLSTASASLYGGEGVPGREDAVPPAPEPFGRHKLGLEDAVRESGVRHRVLRMAHAVGPHQTGQLLIGLLGALRAGEVTVYRGSRRDLIDIADAVAIIDALLRAGVAGETVNVASGHAAAIEDIVDRLEHHLRHREAAAPARRRWVDAASVQAVSTAKLLRLVPAAGRLGFGPGYHRTVIDRHIGTLLRAAAAPPPPGPAEGLAATRPPA